MAVGLDAGTSFYVSARKELVKKQRNAFLTLDGDTSMLKRQLGRLNVPYIEKNNRLHIVGKNAFEYAQIFGSKDLKRPMKSGLLNPTERDAIPILRVIIEELLGPPQTPNELCVYCVPAKPIDSETRVDYHEDTLAKIIQSLGYTTRSVEEGVALAYECLEDDNLTGIAMSMGAGMCNICIMYAGMPAITFSVTRAGDFIDENVARDTGTPSAKAQYMKEKGEVDLSNPTLLVSNGTATLQTNVPKSEIAQAIKSYYVVLINYILANIIKQFETSKDVPTFPIPVPFVIGGGTALVPGFIDLFKEQLTKQPFPIDISEVRLAEDAHIAVANGCLKEAELNVD
jgi:glutaredoxin